MRGRRCFVATRVLGNSRWLREVHIATKQLASFRLGRRRLVRRTDLDAFVAKAEAREAETPADKSSEGSQA